MVNSHPYLTSIRAYTPGATPEDIAKQYGLENVGKVSSNENPFGCSPLAIAAASNVLLQSNRYNDGGIALRHRLADVHGRSMDEITVHNGSDAIIHQIMRTFLSPGDTALSSEGTFISFPIATATCGNTAVQVPITKDYRYDVERIAQAIDATTKVLYIANPNNPTGTYISRERLEWLLVRVPDNVLVILDEAYNEYAGYIAGSDYPDSMAGGSQSILERYPNTISLRTFSKAYGMAAMRVGYAVGNPEIVQWLLKTKLPFDPNGIACAAAIAALDDSDFVINTVRSNAEGLALLHAALDESSITRAASVANFAMADLHDVQKAQTFHTRLLERGFITRPLAGFGLPTCIRLSTGTAEQNLGMCAAIREITPEIAAMPG